MRGEKILQFSIKVINGILKNVLIAVILLILLFAVYVELDTHRMVSEADSTQYTMYRPTADSTLSFEDLQAINPDVIGWLTIDGTKIDYPLVQGEDNDVYVNTSVLGEFSLTGAIFLDSRNDPSFSDTLSIVYGHNMIDNEMFGGLELFKDPDYMDEHLTGTLYYNNEYYQLLIFSCFEGDGYDVSIYRPSLQPEEYGDWLTYILEKTIARTQQLPDSGPILLMSTCTEGATDERTLVAAAIRPGGEPPEAVEEKATPRIFAGYRDDTGGEIKVWHLVAAGIILLFLTIGYERKKKRKMLEENESSE